MTPKTAYAEANELENGMTPETAWAEAMKFENRPNPYTFFDELRKTPVVHVGNGVYVVTGILNPSVLGAKLPRSVPAGTELGTATFTAITTGATVSGKTQVVSGATTGETIVTTGQSTLTSRAGPQKVAILASVRTSTTKKTSTKGSKKSTKKAASSGVDVTIVSLHGSRVTVTTPIGKKTFTIPHGLTITRDGKRVPLHELHAGDVIKVTLGRKDGKRTITSAKLQ